MLEILNERDLDVWDYIFILLPISSPESKYMTVFSEGELGPCIHRRVLGPFVVMAPMEYFETIDNIPLTTSTGQIS